VHQDGEKQAAGIRVNPGNEDTQGDHVQEEAKVVEQPVERSHGAEIRKKIRKNVPHAMDDPQQERRAKHALLQAHSRKGEAGPAGFFQESGNQPDQQERNNDRGNHFGRDED